jgi:hypothetical protein
LAQADRPGSRYQYLTGANRQVGVAAQTASGSLTILAGRQFSIPNFLRIRNSISPY